MVAKQKGIESVLNTCTFKDLSMALPEFKSVPLQIHFVIIGLANAEKWREIQKIVGEERF